MDYACSSRLLVVCARCACSPCLSFCSCVSDASVFGWPPWHLARPGTWHACGAVLAQMLCRHTCIAGTHALQHTLGRCMWCCGLVPIPARAGMGWIPPLNGCSQGLVVRGVAPCTLSYICHTKVFSKVSNSLPIHQYFPTASPYGAQSGGWTYSLVLGGPVPPPGGSGGGHQSRRAGGASLVRGTPALHRAMLGRRFSCNVKSKVIIE